METLTRPPDLNQITAWCESRYAQFNRPEWISPDPLETALAYEEPRERELAAFFASCLALGRVRSIVPSVKKVLGLIGRPLHENILHARREEWERVFEGFVYRFFRREHMVCLLGSLQSLLAEFGSLELAFLAGAPGSDRGPGARTLSALDAFSREIRLRAGGELGILVPLPEAKSARKRLCLYLRWMVRRDSVDPGGWNSFSPADLLVPVDTHMIRVGRALGFTSEKAPTLRACLEITEGFRGINPGDPVKYDFALTRPGILKLPGE